MEGSKAGTGFLEELGSLVGTDDLVVDAEAARPWGQDWVQSLRGAPRAVVFPRRTEQLRDILQLCVRHQVAVVPSGGRTGLAGGAVAAQNELVVNLGKMSKISAVDALTQTIRVEAGAIHQNVQDAASAHGLQWPVDLASKGSCQIGGNLATNAGGLRVIRYGHARRWVQSIEVVLMTGEILELSGDLEKNNTGFELRELLIGSEGTLGIISAATLKLAPRPEKKATLLLGIESFAKALDLLEGAKRSGVALEAFEFWSAVCMENVLRHRGFKAPFAEPASFYVLIDFIEDSNESVKRVESFIAEILASGIVSDGSLAQNSQMGETFWSYRESITESLAAAGLVYKNDLALPLRRIKDFIDSFEANYVRWYGTGVEAFLFGHLGDGNLHVNILSRDRNNPAEFFANCERANDPLFSLVKSLGGSIAAEHGIGLLKKKYLHYSRSPREIEIFRAIKKSFDPTGLLNPGKIF